MSINIVTITGNLTRDPEMRATPSGKDVLGFCVAVNDRRRNQQTGEWEDCPNFIDCTMFGPRAVSLSKILRKGIKVAVSGKLHWSSWEKNGQKRSKVDVYAEEVEIMTQRGKQEAPSAEDSAAVQNIQNEFPGAQVSYYDGDIPF